MSERTVQAQLDARARAQGCNSRAGRGAAFNGRFNRIMTREATRSAAAVMQYFMLQPCSDGGQDYGVQIRTMTVRAYRRPDRARCMGERQRVRRDKARYCCERRYTGKNLVEAACERQDPARVRASACTWRFIRERRVTPRCNEWKAEGI